MSDRQSMTDQHYSMRHLQSVIPSIRLMRGNNASDEHNQNHIVMSPVGSLTNFIRSGKTDMMGLQIQCQHHQVERVQPSISIRWTEHDHNDCFLSILYRDVPVAGHIIFIN